MISVCVVTYNGEKYIKEQIDSIISQLKNDDEIIVSDDESTDDTINILKSYKDLRIKIFIHKKQPQKYKVGYTAKNLENALKYARGDIIFLSDQDDVWLSNKVIDMKLALKEADLVLSDCSIVDKNLNNIIISKFEMEKVKINAFRNFYRSGYLGCCMAFRRTVLDYVLPFPANTPHDFWIALTVGTKGKFKLLNTQTMLYRRHENNVTSNNPNLSKIHNGMLQNKNSLLTKFSCRFDLLLAFLLWRIRHIFS
jgi:glycosyltransferase involved in cell wall biosynthesis